MSHSKNQHALLRGYRSALELSPMQSRKGTRDRIVIEQYSAATRVWQDVGNLLRGAGSDTGKISQLKRLKERAACS